MISGSVSHAPSHALSHAPLHAPMHAQSRSPSQAPSHALSHLADHVLLRDLAALVTQDRATLAALLAHLAEVDARRLYAPAGYPSMYMYCVGALRLSEDAAFRRIRAARTARQFPAIFEALAAGRLNLGSVLLLAPYLTPETSHELLAAATHKTRPEIEVLLARRFPQPDVPALLQPIAPAHAGELLDPGAPAAHACQLAPAPVGMTSTEQDQGPLGTLRGPLAAGPVDEPASQLAVQPYGMTGADRAPGHVDAPSPRAKLTPLSPERFALQVTIAQETHDKLRYAQALLGHIVPSGDMAQVLDRALEALIQKLEQRKFAAVARLSPGPGRRSRRPANARHVPAAVRRAVWQRDQGQCTFVSERGHRCEARTRLEFDHVDPVARGGEATAANLRLRCRAHNQHAADQVFGAGFMRVRREAARQEAEAKRGRDTSREAAGSCHMATARDSAPARAHVKSQAASRDSGPARAHVKSQAASRDQAAAAARAQDVIPWLRQLGFRADEARRGAALCEAIPEAPLEERVRYALRSLAPASAVRSGTGAGATL